VLGSEYDTLLALAGTTDIVVREYLEAYPQRAEAVIRLFRAAQEEGFEEWDRLRQTIERDRKASA